MIQPKRQKTKFGKIHDACGILAKAQDLQDRYNSMAIFIISHYFGTSGMADDHSDIGKERSLKIKFKNVQAKKIVKSNKSISRKQIFAKNPFFVISKMTKNKFLNREKV